MKIKNRQEIIRKLDKLANRIEFYQIWASAYPNISPADMEEHLKSIRSWAKGLGSNDYTNWNISLIMMSANEIYKVYK